MKRYFKLLMLAIMATIISSCSPKQDPINDLEDLATELKENFENFSKEDWENAQNEFVEIENKLNEYEYTDEELKKIGKLKAKCGITFARGAAKMLNDEMHNMKKQFEGAAEEMNSAAEELQDMFEE